MMTIIALNMRKENLKSYVLFKGKKPSEMLRVLVKHYYDKNDEEKEIFKCSLTEDSRALH